MFQSLHPPALVVFSGGQDSTTCLAYALAHHTTVQVVTFDYSQRHRIELVQAATLAQLAGVHQHQIEMTWLNTLAPSALTRADIAIEEKEGELPTTFVDGRNLFFLSVASVIAKQQGIHTIYTGVCETDFSGYPDCRNEFIKSLETTLQLGLDYPIEIRTPLMWMTKAETVLMMKDLGHLDWYAETHTCYEGHRPACGTCPACILRLKGFAEAGIPDPLEYMN
jgi:7-cyano-7-deazaguanine synthase